MKKKPHKFVSEYDIPLRNRAGTGCFTLSGLIELIEFVCSHYPQRDGRANMTVVEVGSHIGESTVEFAKRCAYVISVDPYLGPGRENAKKLFDQNTLPFPHVSQHICTSAYALPNCVDNSIDCVYVDGRHDYESVKFDLQWYDKVKPGGFFTGHDYVNNRWPGVRRAVDEKFGKPDKTFSDSSFLIRKPL